MKVLILEDEPLIAQRLERMVRRSMVGETYDIRISHHLDEARALVKRECFDLCFLDLNLHGQDGFDLIKEQVTSFKTIVTSAYRDKALEAFEYEVLDFVPKPFQEERVRKALHRLSTLSTSTTLLVQSCNQEKVIDTSTILYLKAAKNYTQLSTDDGQQFLSNKSIAVLSNQLQPQFIRVHKSYLVSRAKISALKNQGAGCYRVVLDGDKEVPVSRAKFHELKGSLSS